MAEMANFSRRSFFRKAVVAGTSVATGSLTFDSDGQFQQRIEAKYATLEQGYWRFDDARIYTSGKPPLLQESYRLATDLTPEQVRVELYAESLDGALPIRNEMTQGNPLPGSAKAFTFSTEVPGSRSPDDYTPRVISWHPTARVPLEDSHILWFR